MPNQQNQRKLVHGPEMIEQLDFILKNHYWS